MKKILALIISAVILLSFASCAKNDTENDADTTEVENANNENNVENDTNAQNNASGETVGEALYNDFKANNDGTAQEIADRLLANEVISFAGGSVPVEAGYLTGFDNAEITGFSEGVMFAPMIGTIPFVGYVFVLEDGADVEGFKTTLKDNANLRWNICTQADEMICESEGNKVFFVMCPTSFEDSSAEDDMGVDMGDVPAEDGITLE